MAGVKQTQNNDLAQGEMNSLFRIAVESKASDLHLVVGKPPILRIDGNLKEITGHEILTEDSAKEFVFSIISEQQKAKFVTERELDLSYEIKDYSRFRVNVHWEKGNVGLVARIVAGQIPTMEQVLMPQIAYQMARLQDGLILVTGP